MEQPVKPVLYSFRRCPYAMRARLALYSSGITVELREIVLRDKPAHMLEISPKGSTPVLLLPNGQVIDESLDIMRWALNQNDPDNLLATDKNETNALITRNDGPFKKALDRYKYPNRYPDEDCSGAQGAGLEILQDLNNRIEKHQNLLSNQVSLADLAIFPFTRQFAHVDRDWFYALPLKPLQNWLKNHLESELFLAIMEKYPVWKEGDLPTHFGMVKP